MQLTIREIASLFGQRFDGKDVEIAGFSIDSREINLGEVFFAIKGQNVDGHEFALQAQEKGAALVVCEKPLQVGIPQVIVPSTEEAMITLGAYYKNKFNCQVVGITGSAGKTTTKELTAQMLSARYQVAKNEGNRNTPIGLPMALKVLENDTEIFVAELSGSFMDEIPKLLKIVRPVVGVITNVGPSHLETLGDIDGVAKSKSQLIESLPVGGLAVLNADDPRCRAMSSKTRCKKVTFGFDPEADIQGRLIDGLITVKSCGKAYTFRPHQDSIHFMYDALASMAVATEYGIPLKECVEVAADFKPVEGRGTIIINPSGVRIIDESYNANPVSMKETLRSLAAKPGRRFAVLADMLQLGEDSEKLHQELGEFVASLRLDGVYLFGNLSKRLAQNCPRSLHFETKKDLLDAISLRLSSGDWVLVKGSNGMGMKEVVRSLATHANKEEI